MITAMQNTFVMWTRDEQIGAGLGGLSVIMIGSSVVAASYLTEFPIVGGQALRFSLAAVVLIVWGRHRGQRFRIPTPREMLLLALLGVVGMAGYGLMLVQATAVTEPGTIGVAIGATPLVIVLARAAIERKRPHAQLLLGAVTVVVGAALAQATAHGGLSWNLSSTFWSLAVIVGAASITLLGAPLIATLGSYATTTYGCGLAAVILLSVGLGTQLITGRAMLHVPSLSEIAALTFWSLGVTVLVTLLWYQALARLGASRTGLFNGLVALTSLLAIQISGAGVVTKWQALGAVLVVIGVLVGLTGKPLSQSKQVIVEGATSAVPGP